MVEKQTDSTYSFLIGGLSSAIAYLAGGIDKLFIACTIFIALDFLTGVVSAWYRKELSSRIGWWGLLRKTLMLVFVIVAHQLDVVAGNEEHFMRNAMLMFLIATEGISIFENMGKLGLTYPAFIMNALEKLRGNVEQKDDWKPL